MLRRDLYHVKAIGMIETLGLISSIEAADAMLKAANVELLSQDRIDGGLVTTIIEGDVGAVQAAIDAGKSAAANVGGLLSTHVIPRADSMTYDMIQNSAKKTGKTSPAKDSTNKKTKQSSVKKA